MILPIVAYGTPVLKKKAVDIPEDYEGLETLLEICGKPCMPLAVLV